MGYKQRRRVNLVVMALVLLIIAAYAGTLLQAA